MKGEERVRTAFERAVEAMSRREGVGRGTAVTRIRMNEAFLCEVEDGRWKLTVDMSEKGGGGGRGPDPGVLGRAALGSCFAIAYAQWLIQRGVPVERLEVEIQADYDARAEYGLNDASPAYAELRYVVTVESDAPEAEILRVLDEAEAHSPYAVIWKEPQPLHRQVRVVARGTGPE